MSQINLVINRINELRGWSSHSKKGAIMMKCFQSFTENGTKEEFQDKFSTLLSQVNVYTPKNPNHFWMGITEDPHITLHHGFELIDYKKAYDNGEKVWNEDIKNLLKALNEEYVYPDGTFSERLFHSQLKATPSYINANPITIYEGETNYYTVTLNVTPTEEMVIFRNTLLKTFPHTSNFSDWKIHTSLVTVSDEKSRDYLINSLKDVYVNIYDIKLGYNVK